MDTNPYSSCYSSTIGIISNYKRLQCSFFKCKSVRCLSLSPTHSDWWDMLYGQLWQCIDFFHTTVTWWYVTESLFVDTGWTSLVPGWHYGNTVHCMQLWGGGNEWVKLGHITQYSVLIHILLSAFKVILLHAQVMYQKINGVQIKTKEEIRLSNSIHPACCGSSPMTPSAHPSWAGDVWPVSMVALPDCRGPRFLPQVGWIFGWSQFLADGADHEAF